MTSHKPRVLLPVGDTLTLAFPDGVLQFRCMPPCAGRTRARPASFLHARDHMMRDGVHAIGTLRWICGGEAEQTGSSRSASGWWT